MSRENFETWYLREWGHTEDNHESLFERCPDSSEEYYRLGVRLAHEAWQAATASMQAERDQLAAECAALKHAMSVTMEHVSVMDTGQAGVAAMIINDALHNSETPATDRFLAEQRAQGVEMFADRKNKELFSLHPDTHAIGSIAAAMSAEVKELRDFAAQLRNEVKV